MLAEVVAKGGNLALNIGPTPEGEIEQDAIDRLKEVGDWLKKMEKLSMLPVPHRIIIAAKCGLQLTKTAKRYMLSTPCLKMKHCLLPLNG